jgi:hypothetical protein
VAQPCCPACWSTSVLLHARSDAPPSGRHEKLPRMKFSFSACGSPGHDWRGHAARPCCPACWSTSVLLHARSDAPPSGRHEKLRIKFLFLVCGSPGHDWRGHAARPCCPACWSTSVLLHARSDAPPSGRHEKLPRMKFSFSACGSPGHDWRGHAARPCCPACWSTSVLLHARSDAPPSGRHEKLRIKFLFLVCGSPGHDWRGHAARPCCPACWSTSVLPRARSDAPPSGRHEKLRIKFLFLVCGSPGHDWRGHAARPCCPACWSTSVLPRARSDAPPSGRHEKLPRMKFSFLACSAQGTDCRSGGERNKQAHTSKHKRMTLLPKSRERKTGKINLSSITENLPKKIRFHYCSIVAPTHKPMQNKRVGSAILPTNKTPIEQLSTLFCPRAIVSKSASQGQKELFPPQNLAFTRKSFQTLWRFKMSDSLRHTKCVISGETG